MNTEIKELKDLKAGDRITTNFHEWPNDGGGADYIVVEVPKNDNRGKLVKQIKRLDK